jgi:hypothetical protein
MVENTGTTANSSDAIITKIVDAGSINIAGVDLDGDDITIPSAALADAACLARALAMVEEADRRVALHC